MRDAAHAPAEAAIGFSRWAPLETDSPTTSIEDDMRKEVLFIRGIVADRNKPPRSPAV